MVLKPAEKKARRPAQRTTVEQWADLFDMSYADHVCTALRMHMVEREPHELAPQARTIREHLLKPLDAYMAEVWRPEGRQIEAFNAAQQLFNLAERLAEHFEDRYPFDEESADAWKRQVRAAWVELVALGAGHYLYSEAPRRARAARKAARAARKAKGLTVERVADFFRAADGKHTVLVGELADREGVSERTVERRLFAAKKMKLLP